MTQLSGGGANIIINALRGHMARSSKTSRPESPVLNPDQIRRRIEGLERCIAELEALDPKTVQKRYNIPEAVAIELDYRSLGRGVRSRHSALQALRYAANLDHGPHIARMGPAFGEGPMPDYDAQDAIQPRIPV
ncbi:hypothetical protein [Bradyrhizobium sp.]|uniref:hypothetical protein n=1 Tax=Bradyrhizobium sp. TaxID=376 RepID=UPI001ED15E5F|nr:hypothetical protein [Bradyrhizobium sp.]MBV8922711.1 hypothetical protein [Bradyrhizobium sp.]MBV9985284.1 hypothetical protein [Bradyrhizobium sp.]